MSRVAEQEVSSSVDEESTPAVPHVEKSSVLLLRARDIAVSVLILAILATAVLSSVPSSALKTAAAPVVSPLARATGLDQSWGMFSPNPPRTSSVLEVHVIMATGQDRVWLIADDPSMPGLYWRKIKEEVIKRKEFRAGLATWVLRKMTRKGERPARIAMLVISETLPLEGETKRSKTLIYDRRFPQKTPNPSAGTGAPS